MAQRRPREGGDPFYPSVPTAEMDSRLRGNDAAEVPKPDTNAPAETSGQSSKRMIT